MGPSGDAGSDPPRKRKSEGRCGEWPRLEVFDGGRREPRPEEPRSKEPRDAFTGRPEALRRWLEECRAIELHIRAYLASKSKP